MNFAEILHQKRIEKQLTQQELADALFVTRQTVSRWEKGHNYPTLDMLGDICRILDIDIQDMFPKADASTVLTTANATPKAVPIFIKLLTCIIGLFLTGGLFIFVLLFAKIHDVTVINRYNPFISNHK